MQPTSARHYTHSYLLPEPILAYARCLQVSIPVKDASASFNQYSPRYLRYYREHCGTMNVKDE